MTLMRIIKQAERFTADNSPLILTAIGVTGTVTTAILTGKASIKAVRVIDEAQHLESIKTEHVDPMLRRYELDAKDKVKLVWRLYIPPVAAGALTVTSIILANQIGTRRAAAMAAAYAVSERAFSEYRNEVKTRFGEIKEQSVRDHVAQTRVHQSPVENRQVIIAGGNVLCYEYFTDRYFQSDMESLKKAQNDLNYRINNHGYASLSDFYDLIGLPHTQQSDEMGWNSDNLVELDFTGTLATDGRPCLAMMYMVEPLRKYWYVH